MQNVCQVEKMHKNRMIFVHFVCQVEIFADFRTFFVILPIDLAFCTKFQANFCVKIRKIAELPQKFGDLHIFFMLFWAVFV